jgi:hypothetical protein
MSEEAVNAEKVDNVYSSILSFFERPNRKLTAGDYEFFAKISKAYSDVKGFENGWGYICEKEGIYNGILAFASEVFEASIKALKSEETDKIYAYGFVMEDLSKLVKTAISWCSMMHTRVQRL